jgi:hypothetical protein
VPARIKKKKKDRVKASEGGEEMKEKTDRGEVSSIVADPLRDRLTLVVLFIPYFSPRFMLHLSP